MKPYTSVMGLSKEEGQNCSEVSRNKIVKPIQDSLVPIKILHPSQLSTMIALGREQGPRLGCDEQGLDLSLSGCFSNELPRGSTSGRKAVELQWPSASLSGFGGASFVIFQPP